MDKKEKWLKRSNIMGVLMVIYFSLGSIFDHEITETGYSFLYGVCGLVIIAIAITCAITYYITKNK